MLKRQHTNFYYEFFEKHSLPIWFKSSETIKTDQNTPEKIQFNHKLKRFTVVNCTPNYSEFENLIINPEFGYFTKTFRKGYLMDFSGFKSSSEYLRYNLNSKTYKNLRNDINRLKKQFTIRFEIFYGNNLNPESFHELFQIFEKFIQARFKKLNKKHTGYMRWEEYETNVLSMIIKKKASLMVLYSEDKPIGISLNYHYKDIIDSAITSFDISYSKYSIGKQMFVYQLQWAIENSFQIIDLRWGNYGYKIKFANRTIKYKTHVLYNKNSILEKMVAYTLLIALKWNYQLKEEILLNNKRRQPA